MREIKFRAWDKAVNKMIYGGDDFAVLGEFTMLGGFYEWCRENPVHEIGSLQRLAFIVLMQYTGMKDKNGKEIYEGDIIQYTPFNCNEYKNSIAQVPFIDEGFHWFEELKDMLDKSQYSDQCKITVIGNIHENPNRLPK